MVEVSFGIDGFQNDRKCWLKIDLKEVGIMDKDEICESIRENQWKPCTIHSISVGNHRPWNLNWDGFSSRSHCEVFSSQVAGQNWVLGIVAPEDIFEDIGATIGVLFYALFNWFIQFWIPAPVRWILWQFVRTPSPSTQCCFISCHNSNGGYPPLLRSPTLSLWISIWKLILLHLKSIDSIQFKLIQSVPLSK